MKKSKKDFICAVPFTSLEIHDHNRFLCCASWLKKFLPDNSSPKDAWESEEAQDIRKSIIDGSYKYCDELHCPFLRQLKYIGNVGRVYPLYPKDNLPRELEDRVQKFKNGEDLTPKIIQFSFDRTCNFQCPSCRVSIFTANKTKIAEVEATIEQVQEQYGDILETLYITGSGDPFVSVGFKNFLRNFDKSKFPNLKNIHLHTNASMWNKKMWDSMKNVHGLVRSCEISIDAGTKETYETKTRLGGDWEVLLDNLKFINTIPGLNYIKTSFVVQWHNYKEMPIFYKLMKDIFKDKAKVYFGKITNWGTFSEEEFKQHEIWNPDHPEYSEFVKVIRKTLPAKDAWTNAQEFIQAQNKII